MNKTKAYLIVLWVSWAVMGCNVNVKETTTLAPVVIAEQLKPTEQVVHLLKSDRYEEAVIEYSFEHVIQVDLRALERNRQRLNNERARKNLHLKLQSKEQ